MFLLHLLIAEYPTEKELHQSLQNGTVDKIWMFGCRANYKQISPDSDFTIVSVLDDEFKWHPTIGIRVKLLNKSYFLQKFTECLQNISLLFRNNDRPDHDDGSDDDGENDHPFWKQDVRKHCLILLTASHFRCEFLSHLLSPNVSP